MVDTRGAAVNVRDNAWFERAARGDPMLQIAPQIELVDKSIAWTADIVVCDIRMPRYSGVWLIEHLRTLYPSTSIVISTGYGEIDPALMARARITGYLAKPYDRDTLIASLDQAMQSRRAALEPPVH